MYNVCSCFVVALVPFLLSVFLFVCLSSCDLMAPGATGPDRDLHARQDSHPQDLPHPDLPSPLVAEDPRVGGHGLVSGACVRVCVCAYSGVRV